MEAVVVVVVATVEAVVVVAAAMEAVVVVAVAVEAAVMLPAWISKFSRTLMSCPLDGVLLYCRKCPIQGYENPSERPKPRKKTVTQLSCKLFLTDHMCGLHVAGKWLHFILSFNCCHRAHLFSLRQSLQ